MINRSISYWNSESFLHFKAWVTSKNYFQNQLIHILNFYVIQIRILNHALNICTTNKIHLRRIEIHLTTSSAQNVRSHDKSFHFLQKFRIFFYISKACISSKNYFQNQLLHILNCYGIQIRIVNHALNICITNKIHLRHIEIHLTASSAQNVRSQDKSFHFLLKFRIFLTF